MHLKAWRHIARSFGVGRPKGKPPLQQQPDHLRAEYLRLLQKTVLRALGASLQRHVVDRLPTLLARTSGAAGARLDSADDIAAAIEAAKAEFAQDVPKPRLRGLAAKVGRDTSTFQAAQLNRQVRHAIGVDVIPTIPEWDVMLDDFVGENVALITEMTEGMYADIETMVYRAAREGTRAEELAKQIQDQVDVTKSRAELIARDQIGKLYGEVQAARQRELGITSYIWRNMGDERVRGNPEGIYPKARPSHWTREGKMFEWKHPPEDGHPGQPIRCRCYAEPVLDELLDEGESEQEAPEEAEVE